MKEKVLILGVAGFTGRHFSNYISDNGLTDTFDFLGVDSSDCKGIALSTKELDLTLHSNVRELLVRENPLYIINLIGSFASNDFSQMLKVNVGISQDIISICQSERIQTKNILLLGSAAEYGAGIYLPISEDQKPCPVSLYGLSKLFQTEMALYYFRNHQAKVTIARPFNLLGKGLSRSLSIGSFVKQIQEIKDSGPILVGNIKNKRDFIDINDAIDAYWKLLLFGKPGEIYNICSGHSHSIQEILEVLIKISKKKINVVVKDEFVKKDDIKDSYGNNSKLKELTNWQITESLENSLLKMI